MANLIEISWMIVNFCRAERTHMQRPTNGTWKQRVCRQSGKEKEGGLKEEEPFSFLKIKIQSQTCWKTNLERGSLHLILPLWNPALATGIKEGSLSSEFCGPVEGVSFHVQWKTGKQAPVVISQRSDERLNFFSPLWGCLLCHYSPENYLWDNTADWNTGITSCLRYPTN